MKKIILTEKQLDKLISEESMYDLIHKDPDIHYVEVRECDFNYHNVTYKGKEINTIGLYGRFKIEYRVEPEYRRYGIKSISVYDIKGPNEIQILVEYYDDATPDNDINEKEEAINLALDWGQMINENEDDTIPYFGVDDEVSIDLINDEQGNLVVRSINVNVKHF